MECIPEAVGVSLIKTQLYIKEMERKIKLMLNEYATAVKYSQFKIDRLVL